MLSKTETLGPLGFEPPTEEGDEDDWRREMTPIIHTPSPSERYRHWQLGAGGLGSFGREVYSIYHNYFTDQIYCSSTTPGMVNPMVGAPLSSHMEHTPQQQQPQYDGGGVEQMMGDNMCTLMTSYPKSICNT